MVGCTSGWMTTRDAFDNSGTVSEAHLDNQLSDLVSIRAFSSRPIAYPNSLQMASSTTSNALPDLFRPTTYEYDWSNDQYESQPGFLRQMPWFRPIFDSIFSQTARANFPAVYYFREHSSPEHTDPTAISPIVLTQLAPPSTCPQLWQMYGRHTCTMICSSSTQSVLVLLDGSCSGDEEPLYNHERYRRCQYRRTHLFSQ